MPEGRWRIEWVSCHTGYYGMGQAVLSEAAAKALAAAMNAKYPDLHQLGCQGRLTPPPAALVGEAPPLRV